jgi:DnaK suppressor protein
VATEVERTHLFTAREARQRLAHERNSRLAQLTAIEGHGPAGVEDIAAAQTAAIRSVLAEIDAAENRISDGTYGMCQLCGQTIPAERLEILPYVRHCVACQQMQLA